METRKILSLIGVALLGFLGPLEYSVVMPSLWFYLQQFGVESQIFYSVVLSSFSFAHMLASPLVGYLADRRPMKELLVLGLLVSAGGHAFYALAWDEWGVLIGRFVAGLGASNFTLVSVYVARITTVENRTKVTARLNIFTEMGLLLGPAFAIVFEQVDFYLGPFHVNKYTSPGYLMFLACVLLALYILVCFENPATTQAAAGAPENTINATEEEGTINDGNDGNDAETKPLLGKGDSSSSSSSTPAIASTTQLSRIFTRATITVLFTQFILFFNQTAMESILAPLTEEYYDFTPFENSLIFVAIALTFLVMYFLISVVSTNVQDRTLIALGLVTEFTSILFSFLIFLLVEHPPFWLFSLGTALFVIGLPFFFCCTSSLMTKLVEERDVGLASGFLSSAMNLANIAGPLWGGSFSVEPWLPFAGELALVTLLAGVFCFSFRSLYIPKKEADKN